VGSVRRDVGGKDRRSGVMKERVEELGRRREEEEGGRRRRREREGGRRRKKESGEEGGRGRGRMEEG
jgi:hypothetical protein